MYWIIVVVNRKRFAKWSLTSNAKEAGFMVSALASLNCSGAECVKWFLASEALETVAGQSV